MRNADSPALTSLCPSLRDYKRLGIAWLLASLCGVTRRRNWLYMGVSG